MGANGSTCHLLKALEGCFLDRDLKSQVLLKSGKASASWGIYGHAAQDSCGRTEYLSLIVKLFLQRTFSTHDYSHHLEHLC